MVHAQVEDEHWVVVALQHCPATQSPLVRQPLTQALPLQTLPLGQSVLMQQEAPATQAESQHFSPAPHWASAVHPHVDVDDEQWFVAKSQHCPATQSAAEEQPFTQAPALQKVPSLQSAFLQHVALVQEPPQHFSPPPHWASSVQVQVAKEHWFVDRLQHWPATQSPSLQQEPATQAPLQHR